MNFDIRKRRLATCPKITLQEIADLSGVSVSGIRKIELSDDPNPTLRVAISIENALAKLEAERGIGAEACAQ